MELLEAKEKKQQKLEEEKKKQKEERERKAREREQQKREKERIRQDKKKTACGQTQGNSLRVNPRKQPVSKPKPTAHKHSQKQGGKCRKSESEETDSSGPGG